MPGRARPRASRLETLGAWLHLWTPPRDVEVPPPSRRLLLGVLGVLALAGLAVALAAPRIDAGKDRAAAERAAALDARRAATRRRVAAEGRPQRAVAADLRPAATPAGRRRLIARVEAAIAADARRRVARGELRRAGATRCRVSEAAGRHAALNCLVTTSEIAAGERNVAGRLGYPFRAIVDFRAAAFTWCRTHPVPSEKIIPDPRTLVPVDPACRELPRRDDDEPRPGPPDAGTLRGHRG